MVIGDSVNDIPVALTQTDMGGFGWLWDGCGYQRSRCDHVQPNERTQEHRVHLLGLREQVQEDRAELRVAFHVQFVRDHTRR